MHTIAKLFVLQIISQTITIKYDQFFFFFQPILIVAKVQQSQAAVKLQFYLKTLFFKESLKGESIKFYVISLRFNAYFNHAF